MDKKKLLELRLKGMTYQAIANEAGVSRQRIQQLLSPPEAVRVYVVNKYHGCCKECGLLVGNTGHIHHEGGNEENYNDIENLELLCISCHRIKHSTRVVEKTRFGNNHHASQPDIIYKPRVSKYSERQRDTVILPVRIKKDLMAEVEEQVPQTKQKSRNSWVIWCIKNGLRPHKRKG